MNKILLRVGGMSCSACAQGLEKYLNKQPEILSASVNLVLSQVLIEYKDGIGIKDLENFIKEAGFESLGVYNNKTQSKNHDNSDKKKFVFFFIIILLIMYIKMSKMLSFPSISFLDVKNHPINYSISLFVLTSLFLIWGIDILKGGYKNLIHKTPNMDTLVSIGVLSSYIYSTYCLINIILGKTIFTQNLYFESVVMIIFLIKLGRFIDAKNKEKTNEAIKELVQITPDVAFLKRNNKIKEILIDDVQKGDILIAKPGMKISVDGIITSGDTHLNESFITGESKSNKKGIGDIVLAGSINYDGYIEYKAEKIGKESTISEIVRLVLEATNTKSPIMRLADKISGYFVPIIIAIAFINFICYLLLGFNINEAINSFVTILVVACPCALGLATPLAIVVSEGLCAQKGILVKSSEILENAYKVDTIVFDKTGTLTYGNLKISQIFNYSNYTNDELIGLVSNLESKSSHPIAQAFVDYFNNKQFPNYQVLSFKNIPGIGISGNIDDKVFYIGNEKLFNKFKIKNHYKENEQKLSNLGNSVVYVIENKKVIALIGLNDIIRSDAKTVIKNLQDLGKKVIMLTGDNEITANKVSRNLGINELISNVMPKDKTNIIKNLIKQKQYVMMVGDGINDAPALVTAHIGVSINGGTDIAINSANVILMGNSLEKIITLITISKKTVKIIKQNLFWAFFYNICMIPIAVGLLKPINISMNPIIASLAMMISSLTIVFNTLRLKNIKF